jgi:hypothetical protein
MLYSEIIAVGSQILTKHLDTLCGQNVEFLCLNPVVQIDTRGLEMTVSPKCKFGKNEQNPVSLPLCICTNNNPVCRTSNIISYGHWNERMTS